MHIHYTVCWSLLFESLKFMVSLFLNSHSPFFFKNNNRVIKYKVAAPSFKPAFLYRIYTVYICMPFLGGASSLTSFLIPLLKYINIQPCLLQLSIGKGGHRYFKMSTTRGPTKCPQTKCRKPNYFFYRQNVHRQNVPRQSVDNPKN